MTAAGIAAAGALPRRPSSAPRASPALYEWDAWSFWIPKAKAIYYLRRASTSGSSPTLPGSSYPPLVPVLDAAAFHAHGQPRRRHAARPVLVLRGRLRRGRSPGCSRERVPRVDPLAVRAPPLSSRRGLGRGSTITGGRPPPRLPLRARRRSSSSSGSSTATRWRLVVATVLLCGMVLTKREGLLLGAVLLGARSLASAREWRSAWPRSASSPAPSPSSRPRGGSGTSRTGSGGEAPTGGWARPDDEHRSALAVAPARPRRALLERLLERDHPGGGRRRWCSPPSRAPTSSSSSSSLSSLSSPSAKPGSPGRIPELADHAGARREPVVRLHGCRALLVRRR